MNKWLKISLIVFSIIIFAALAIFGFIYSKDYFLSKTKEIQKKNQENSKSEEEKDLDDISNDIKASTDLDISELDSLDKELGEIDVSGI